MLIGGRLQGAIDVLTDVETRFQPASVALANWGKQHRFAGSADREFIGHLVYDCLRQKQSLAWRMDDDSPRALVMASFVESHGRSCEQLEAALASDRHAPSALTDAERLRMCTESLTEAPSWVRGNYPQWLSEQFDAIFGCTAVSEGEAMARRAPIDMRVNRLKTSREKLLKAFQKFDAQPCAIAPDGIRIDLSVERPRTPKPQAEPAFGKGWCEVQDEGSQIAALASAAAPGMQVLDLCAGGGGKTLSLAALMANKGQIYAHDIDLHRLRPIFPRLKRAGVRNTQIIGPSELSQLVEKMDCVLVDAPCSGSGTWRRHPDSKWRLSRRSLDQRIATQTALIDQAATFLKPGAHLLYVTCSVLPSENEDQITAALSRLPQLRLNEIAPEIVDTIRAHRQSRQISHAEPGMSMLQLTPRRDDTDGFFIANLQRRPE